MKEKAILRSVSVPRPTTMTGTCRWLIALPIVFYIVIATLALIIGLPEFYRERGLKERGVHVAGVVTGSYITSIQQRRTKEPIQVCNLKYTFTPKGQPGTPKSPIAAEVQFPPQACSQMHPGTAMPVIYDPLRPDRCVVGFGDLLGWMQPYGILHDLVVAQVLLLPFFALLVLLVLAVHHRQKRLLRWGAVADATIVAEREYSAGRAGLRSLVTYEFRDLEGRTIQGKCKDLPTSGNADEPFVEHRQRFMIEPLVLFDPRHSRRNRLYPFGLVRPKVT